LLDEELFLFKTEGIPLRQFFRPRRQLGVCGHDTQALLVGEDGFAHFVPALVHGVVEFAEVLDGLDEASVSWSAVAKVVFLYNLLDLKRTTWEGPELRGGKHTIVFDFKSDGPGLGKGGTGVLSVDGKEAAKNSLEHTTPVTFPEDETFDVGQDTRTGVAIVEYRYDVPFSSPARSTS
jgi:hypothetical protein